MLATCGLLVAGWKRHRQLGFVVLAAWSAVSATWYLGFQIAGRQFQQIGAALNIDAMSVHLLINLCSSTLLSLFLLFGVALLVFGKRMEQPRQS